jgi:hypothetical protein
MDFYLANDDDDQSAEEKSVVNNILKGYSKKEFLPVSTLEKEGPVRAHIFDTYLFAYIYMNMHLYIWRYM